MTTSGQPSRGSLRRTAVGLVALAALWNAVYWLWQPNDEPPVVLAAIDEDTTPDTEPAVEEPEPPPPVVLTMGDPQPPQQEAEPPLIVDPILYDPADQLTLIEPEFRAYEVTERDRTLGDIALRFYGDRNLAEVIKRANPFKDPRRLTTGQVWRVPIDPENIQGVVVDADGNPAEPASDEPASDTYTTYTAKANDTLGGISKQHYDTTRYAQAIYEFNRERLSLRSIRSIRPGQVLHIPKDPN